LSKVLHNILYIEDEPDIQRVVKLALEAMAGMHVIGCNSGAEAIARSADTEIDLILLDVMMPNMDGPTTLSRLREIPALAQTPVVFMTAKAHPSEIAHFKALGALDVIAKPFDPMVLAVMLRAIWARAFAGTQPAATTRSADSELSADERFAARMLALTEQFQRELPARFDALREQWQALQESWSLDTLRALHTNTHNLAGAGSTFGYDELTVRARALDRRLKVLLAEQQPPDAATAGEISSLFTELEAELQCILAQLER
jgi:two-component system, OmpR family, response regulator